MVKKHPSIKMGLKYWWVFSTRQIWNINFKTG